MGMSELVSRIDYGKFFEEIMNIDPNIRFAASYDGQFNAKYRDGIQGYFNDEEVRSFLSKAQKRWDSRKQMSLKIGDPKFAMAQYGKINRITIPLENDGVILVTTEIGVDINKLVTGIIQIRNKFFD
jgi:hypothetical protein